MVPDERRPQTMISPGTVKSRLERALAQLSKDDHLTNASEETLP
jgi:hypothetical protein